MIYQQLFERAEAESPVRAGVIGTGQYATAIITQRDSILENIKERLAPIVGKYL